MHLDALQLPIAWEQFGWPEHPDIGGVALSTGDPRWGWEPTGPAFPIHTMERPHSEPVEGYSVDHVVLLVPSLDAAIGTLDRAGIGVRLRSEVGGRPAAFFRVGPVLEVIESPVREPSIYGMAITTHEQSLDALSLRWKGLGLSVGDIKPAVQRGRRIFTVHDLDAGFAVMSPDGALPA